MTKTCPSCGTVAAPEARFCRRCGTLLRAAVGGDERDGQVSPLAATVPLTDEGRTTHGLAADDPSRSPDTNRVNRAELDALLRPSRQESTLESSPARNAHDDGQHHSFINHYSEPTPNAPQNSDPGSMTQPSLQLFPQTVATEGERRDAAAGSGDYDDELTITVARPPATTPRQVVPIPRTGSDAPPSAARGDGHAAAHANGETLASASPSVAPAVNARPAAPKSRTRQAWYVAAGVSVLLLLATLTAFWLGVGPFRRGASAVAGNGATETPAVADPKQLSDEKMTEAEALLAGGDLDAAIARLREATTLNPSNNAAHRRLGALLFDNGRRREAIEEYRAIIRSDARDAEAWRALARAQLDESLYVEASESYRQLIALAGEGSLNDNELLAYAESLRLSGRARDAQTYYQRLVSSSVADVANSARQYLGESVATVPTPTTSPELAHDAREQLNQNRNAQTSQTPALPTPTPALASVTTPPANVAPPAPPARSENLSAGDLFKRGEQLWSSNRAAALNDFRAAAGKGNRDAYYYLGLGIAEGKDPRTLHPALLGAAYQYFQNAMRGGRFRADARRYEQILGEEVDRRRQQR
ncbi:MAG TPA: tetratricopeptide repeat protein [Pyrinomonadaceae bacterium]|jgi:tetratricopeptide (TPR) repeat protein